MKWLALLIFLGGCASTELKGPQSHFNLPESLGGTLQDSIWSLEAGLNSNVTIEPIKDPSLRPVDLAQVPYTSSDTALLAKADVSLMRWLDMYFRVGNDSEPTQLGFKFQFIGKSISESQPGDWSLATVAGYGRSSSKSVGSKEGDETAGTAPSADTFPWKAKSEIELFDFSIVAGYRMNEDTLIYAGPFATYYKYNLYIDHFPSSNGADKKTVSYEDNGHGQAVGFHLGTHLKVSTDSFLNLEWDVLKSSFEDNEKSWDFLSGSMGTRF